MSKVICPHGAFIRFDEPFTLFNVEVEDSCPQTCRVRRLKEQTEHQLPLFAGDERFAPFAPPHYQPKTD